MVSVLRSGQNLVIAAAQADSPGPAFSISQRHIILVPRPGKNEAPRLVAPCIYILTSMHRQAEQSKDGGPVSRENDVARGISASPFGWHKM